MIYEVLHSNICFSSMSTSLGQQNW